MTERIHRQARTSRRADEQVETQTVAAADLTPFDDLLEEIDAVLATDAEEYVKGFVQKGGQ